MYAYCIQITKRKGSTSNNLRPGPAGDQKISLRETIKKVLGFCPKQRTPLTHSSVQCPQKNGVQSQDTRSQTFWPIWRVKDCREGRNWFKTLPDYIGTWVAHDGPLNNCPNFFGNNNNNSIRIKALGLVSTL